MKFLKKIGFLLFLIGQSVLQYMLLGAWPGFLEWISPWDIPFYFALGLAFSLPGVYLMTTEVGQIKPKIGITSPFPFSISNWIPGREVDIEEDEV